MKPRSFDPLKLDVGVFAREGGTLEGEWPATSLTRLAEAAAPESDPAQWPPVSWSTRGELRTPKGGEPQAWLELTAEAQVAVTCQRCLQPVREDLAVSRWFRFVKDEDMAAEMDMDSDDDVLALPRHLDLRELVEDELLLTLPVVPRHEVCPEPLPHANVEEEELPAEERPNPFAALAALKKGSGGKA
ncbi:YceD family protein [Roseateles chitinivorans]|uniref:YceD family protein n=1 Tax=Roseateles chitinivorans TaxID=2917965 RepID=UPI003D67E5B6